MNTKSVRLFVVILGLVITPRVFAANFVGETSLLYLTEDKATGFSAALGSRTPSNHYFGAEFIYYKNSESVSVGAISGSGEIEVYSSGVTYKYFAPLSAPKKIYLYVGGGVGLTLVNVSGTVTAFRQTSNFSDNSPNNFSFQLLAGLEVPLGQTVALKAGWRYLNVQGVEFKFLRTPSQNFDTHALELGLNFRF